jgi:hypothetical protein
MRVQLHRRRQRHGNGGLLYLTIGAYFVERFGCDPQSGAVGAFFQLHVTDNPDLKMRVRAPWANMSDISSAGNRCGRRSAVRAEFAADEHQTETGRAGHALQ